jgi:replicative DNA helicase
MEGPVILGVHTLEEVCASRIDAMRMMTLSQFLGLNMAMGMAKRERFFLLEKGILEFWSMKCFMSNFHVLGAGTPALSRYKL